MTQADLMQKPSEASSIEKILTEIKSLRNEHDKYVERHESFVNFVEKHHPELLELWKVQQALELYKR